MTGTTATILDDDTRGVAVSPIALTVPEGGSATYTVVLTSQPTATVTPSRSSGYRRFTPGLTTDDARLAEKRGWLFLSFRGTFTRYPSTG